jgi:hypothetical protein
VGITTLEEVFLQIGHGKINKKDKESFKVEHLKRSMTNAPSNDTSINTHKDSFETVVDEED